MPQIALPIVKVLSIPPAHVCVACLDEQDHQVHLFHLPEPALRTLTGHRGAFNPLDEPPCLPLIQTKTGLHCPLPGGGCALT
jgi:hypothetical protein